MKTRNQRTLALIFSRPAPAGVRWLDVTALLLELGAQITEREGSRVAIFLFGQVKVMHRPHPSPYMDKGAVTSLRKWLEENGVCQ
ncbi:MAG TPA: type II toxin-antitoxin system HicA family toxin [Castellaniella sp.]|nr:type II toxin-antitoxin system HicA family toxin [Castellaniella sp.]